MVNCITLISASLAVKQYLRASSLQVKVIRVDAGRGLPPIKWRAFLIDLEHQGSSMSKIKSDVTETKKRVVHDAAFRREAVRILATGGRTIEEVAANLGIGRSTLSKWKTKLDRVELMAGPHDDVEKELKRLRREVELLRAERDLLKKATVFFAKETSR